MRSVDPLKLGLAVAVVCALAALFWPRGEPTAPGGFLLDADGRPAPLGERMAPVTLLHFWGTWCPPCLTEVPAIQRLRRDLADEPDFAVIMVAVNDDQEAVEGFLGPAAAGVLHDPSWEVAHRYGTRQLPETYLVVDGTVREKFVGATDWDGPEARAQVRAALSEVVDEARVGGDELLGEVGRNVVPGELELHSEMPVELELAGEPQGEADRGLAAAGDVVEVVGAESEVDA